MDELRVGICEDDPHLRSVLERALHGAGFGVRATATGADAVRTFAGSAPDVLVLDIMLPDADGRDVCQALRVKGVECPVIFLTARDALPDRLSGFELGADDYVTKPFAIAELIARIRVAGRRPMRPAAPPRATIEVDPVMHSVRSGDRVAQLTPTEFRLLAALAARPGEVLRRHELCAAGWSHGAIVHDNTLDAYMLRLRRKLAEVASRESLQTVRGVGYVLR